MIKSEGIRLALIYATAVKPMKTCTLEQKVAFLKCAEAYGNCGPRVLAKETHMSWVFLTEKHAWKLKKPVRTDYADFTTSEARRLNCIRELHLNRRLAEDVYLAVVPLTITPEGSLELNGAGEPVDWLVQMRRLPSDRMMDRVIANDGVSDADIWRLAPLLADFYNEADRARITCDQYRERLSADLKDAERELTNKSYGLPPNLVTPLVHRQLDYLQRCAEVFDDRVRQGRIVEGHGDLRPEHICLLAPPMIIDCLEFNRDLRVLDAASELAFLSLECERLGALQVGQHILKAYSIESGDRPAAELLAFYRAYHACVRAKIALWHLKDFSVTNRGVWKARARSYLRMAASEPLVVRFAG